MSSDLSVDEAIVLDEAGYDACGLVTGSAVYRPSIFGRYAPMSTSTELTELSSALHLARSLAMNRLLDQAQSLGADGVAGVELEMRGAEGRGRDMEFFAMGTAVVRRADPGASSGTRRRRRDGHERRPFTSDLSGQQLYLLERAGFAPVEMVMGVCVYHVARQSVARWWSNVTANTELVNVTEALYESRELAMGRMQKEAEDAGAEGVVGVRIDEHAHIWGSQVIEFLAIGTAVVALEGGHQPLDVRTAMPLDDATVATDVRRLLGG